MKETKPGQYRASVMIPGGKPVTDAALVGRLALNGVESAPVQAAKLITINPLETPEKLPAPPVVAAVPAPVPEPAPVSPPAPTPAPEVAPAPVTTPEPAPEPVPPPVVEPPKPEPPTPEPTKVKPPVVLTAPANEARIQRTLLITGTADPGSKVMVTVSYSNEMGGILNLSGQVSSQLVAAGENGQFQMGPIALEGPLATMGLVFTVKAGYPESTDQQGAVVSVFGDRS
jgi:hypothetical protein